MQLQSRAHCSVLMGGRSPGSALCQELQAQAHIPAPLSCPGATPGWTSQGSGSVRALP